MTLKLIRSFLLAPANRPDLLAKFPRFGADCCVIDMEDGTPAADKAAARAALPGAVGEIRGGGYTGLLTVRVNEPGSPLYLDDLAAAFGAGIDGVVIPKVEDPGQLWPAYHHISRLAAASPRQERRFIVCGIESARGVQGAARLCRPDLGVGAVYFGAEDYASNIGGRRTPEGREIYTARSMVVMAAKGAGIQAIDQAVVDIRNDAQYLADAAAGRELGYEGKTCVTPGQVKLAHDVFSPTPAERDFARRLVAAYEEALGRRVGVIEFEGQMVDGPLLKRAQAILSMPEAG
ncbi:HpcH/HpaI aldolase/citrate lyase family protein [Achromobacter denitrificans]